MAIPASQIVTINATVSGASAAPNILQFGDADMGGAVQVSQLYTGWTRSSVNASGDASYVILTSAIVPGGTMGLNSKLVIIPDWIYPNSSSSKTMGVDFGGSNISLLTLTTGSVGGEILLGVKNLNSLSSQKTMNGSSYGINLNPRIATSIDTSQDVQIDFKCRWGAATSGETITLMGYSIYHYPGS